MVGEAAAAAVAGGRGDPNRVPRWSGSVLLPLEVLNPEEKRMEQRTTAG